MKTLLKDAVSSGVIDTTLKEDCRKLAHDASEVLHQKPTTLEKSFEILFSLNDILKRVYAT